MGPREWIGRIAARELQQPWRAVWDHADNHSLKEKRGDPALLLEGDELALPDVESAGVEVAMGGTHRFVLGQCADTLRIRVCGVAAYLDLEQAQKKSEYCEFT